MIDRKAEFPLLTGDLKALFKQSIRLFKEALLFSPEGRGVGRRSETGREGVEGGLIRGGGGRGEGHTPAGGPHSAPLSPRPQQFILKAKKPFAS